MSNLLLLSIMGLTAAALPAVESEMNVTPMPLAMSLQAPANDNGIETDPDGQDALYVMNCQIITDWGYFEYPSLKSEVRWNEDGKTVYFHNLFPRYKECWVKGEIEGDEIVIPSEQPIYEDPYYGVVYFYASRAGEDGVFNTIDDMRLKMITDEHGHEMICSADTTVLGGVVKFDKDGAGYLVLNGYYDMLKYDDPFAQVPEGLATEQYMLAYTDYYNHSESKTVELAFDGEDVYLSGLIPDATDGGWVKGTIEGDSIVIPSMQAAHSSTYLLDFCAGYVAQYDEWGAPLFADKDVLKLGLSADKKLITSAEGDFALTIYGNRQAMIYAIEKIKYLQYEGDKPAVPAKPQITIAADYCIEFELPMEDVDGNYINPEKISWSAFFDDELFVFDPSEYIMLDEPTSEFPFEYTDQYDIMSYGSTHMFFIYDVLYEVVEIQSYYTVDGVRNASEKASNVTTPTGLISVEPGTKVTGVEYYDLTGRRMESAASTCVARITMSNGEVKTSRIFGK